MTATETAPTSVPRFKTSYQTEIRDQLKESLELPNVMQVPRMEKIVINMGVGEAVVQSKTLDAAVADLALIAGQKPVTTKAKKSVATFKLREGNAIGAKVTLRGDRMWEFFDRLVSLAIPRIKDFRGFSPKSFDGRGSYSFGLTEQGIFPEVDMANAQHTFGMHVTLVFRNSTNDLSRTALTELGFPFRKPAAKK